MGVWEKSFLADFFNGIEHDGSPSSSALKSGSACEHKKPLTPIEVEEGLKITNIYFRPGMKVASSIPRIVGRSKALMDCLGLLKKASSSDITVLIEGETGVGKELVARAIHFMSARRDCPFVAQNCAALPGSLLESELFGHKRGAFTGACHDKKGLLAMADGGTILLDEIGDMPPDLQAKLLRVLEAEVIRPVGGIREINVDLRIISLTNRNLGEEVKAGRFREDLYYRLNAFLIRVPPLRERKEDIPVLVGHFIEQNKRRLNKNIRGISGEALNGLAAYDFPGNVRELENEIEKAMVMAEEGGLITLEDLSPKFVSMAPERQPKNILSGDITIKDAISALKKELIAEALKRHGGNKSKAAKQLGIHRNCLAYMMKRLDLSV